MATTQDYIVHVCDQISGVGTIRYRKMFGEYMVYVNDRPIFTVCDNTVYAKMLDCVRDRMAGAEMGAPYEGAKVQYILDIDNGAFAREIAGILAEQVPVSKPKKKSK